MLQRVQINLRQWLGKLITLLNFLRDRQTDILHSVLVITHKQQRQTQWTDAQNLLGTS